MALQTEILSTDTPDFLKQICFLKRFLKAAPLLNQSASGDELRVIISLLLRRLFCCLIYYQLI